MKNEKVKQDSQELVEAIRRLARGKSRGSTLPVHQGIDTSPGCAFGALVDERLKEMERNIAEVKTRINGLIFLVAGAVVAEIIMRLF